MFIAAVLGVLVIPTRVAAQPQRAAQYPYTITDLGTLGGGFSAPDNLTNTGRVVGVSAFAGDNTVGAYLWQNGVMKSLPSLGGPQAGASGINASGLISGWADTTTPAPPSVFNTTSEFCDPPAPDATAVTCHAVLWDGRKVIDLGTLGGANSAGNNYGLNDSGQVVGASETTTPDPSSATGTPEYHAFLWQRGTMTDLGTLGGPDSNAWGINNVGQVVGGSTMNADPSTPQHAFLWQRGTMRDLGTLGGTFSFASAIDNRGQAVGFSALVGNTATHAFLWQHGAMTDLGTLPGDVYSNAIDAVDQGQVFGTSCSNAQCRAVMWDKGTITDLNLLISPGSGWQLIDATTRNARGQIVGDGVHDGLPHAYLLTPVQGTNVTSSTKAGQIDQEQRLASPAAPRVTSAARSLPTPSTSWAYAMNNWSPGTTSESHKGTYGGSEPLTSSRVSGSKRRAGARSTMPADCRTAGSWWPWSKSAHLPSSLLSGRPQPSNPFTPVAQ